MSKVVSPQTIAESLTEHWSPKVIGEVDNNYVKVAKVKGTFTWHSHDDEDEMFYILKGSLRIEMEDQTVELNAGDMYVVPRGVRHNPIADEECQILLIEQKSTLHTGDVKTEQTKEIYQQLIG
ncbi:MAG: mannose-6-phosphate isomerase-like protein (cupin superfamily) [Phenylobacterium sp.]